MIENRPNTRPTDILAIFVLKIKKQMVLEIPDQILSHSKYTVAEFRLDIAIMLYQKQAISLARAAEWVGFSRLEFQKELKARAIHLLHYEISDLYEEMAAFRKTGL
jgi:predicted HTH domain antitoxin